MARPSTIGDFVRSHPRDMPVKDLIKLGKKAGLGVISKSYISKVRCEAPPETWAKPRVVMGRPISINGHSVEAAPEPKVRAAPYERTLATPQLKPVTEAELQFRKLLVVVGTERAQAFIDAYRAADEAALRS